MDLSFACSSLTVLGQFLGEENDCDCQSTLTGQADWKIVLLIYAEVVF